MAERGAGLPWERAWLRMWGGSFGEEGAAGRGAGLEGRGGGMYLSSPGANRHPAMALRHVVSVVCSGAPRLAPLSTAPATREQRAAGPVTGLRCGAAEPARPQFPAVDFGNAQEAYRSRRSWELVRSLLVLRLCASPALLARHEQVRRWSGG